MPVVRAALERGQRVRLAVSGSSMLPFIHDGDTIELLPLGVAPRAGDIVLAEASDGQYVLHRVVRADGELYFLRGDAQERDECAVRHGDLLGQATTVQRNGHIYALDRGAWKIAGLLWIHCQPHSSRLFRLGRRLKARLARAWD